jgi:hypothetical protein
MEEAVAFRSTTLVAALTAAAIGAQAQAPLPPPADVPQPAAPEVIAPALSPPTSLLAPAPVDAQASSAQSPTQSSMAPPSNAMPGAPPAGIDPAPFVPQTQNGVAFVSGGVGDEGRTALREMEPQYNLRLLFAESGGAYLSDVDVQLTDQGGNRLVAAVSNGPFFFARVGPGRYVIDAISSGRPQTHSVIVEAGAPTSEAFYWPSSG